MSGKKTPTNPDAAPQTLKIGSRVRCTDDQVEGRIVWANGTSVKIKWDDGEQVTWRRDSLAGRSIEMVGTDDEEGRTEAPAGPAGPARTATTELSGAGPETPTPVPAVPGTAFQAAEPPAAEPAAPAAEPTKEQAVATGVKETTPQSAKPRARPRATAAAPKKVSALDAAAQLLAEEGRAMNCQEMIEAMAAKGYWTSPGGRTPAATLYSAILREVAVKGPGARFVKAQRGLFARNGAV